MKMNCWEFKKCKREARGELAIVHSVCPASTNQAKDDINNGTNAGRYCWKVAGTFCSEKKQGTFALKLLNCAQCDFFKLVKREEKEEFRV